MAGHRWEEVLQQLELDATLPSLTVVMCTERVKDWETRTLYWQSRRTRLYVVIIRDHNASVLGGAIARVISVVAEDEPCFWHNYNNVGP